MDVITTLKQELSYLKAHKESVVMISTTAKHALQFKVLPRRNVLHVAMSCFMINNEKALKKTLRFFDGEVSSIYIDIEQKQEINLFETARKIVKKSDLLSVKPNDNTLESCDLLVRKQFNDDLSNKKVVVIGTGNLAGKIATRLAERQAEVYIIGRTVEKENNAVNALNFFLPKNTFPINAYEDFPEKEKANLIISFLSGKFTMENRLNSAIGLKSFIIDGGINNFSKEFIQNMLNRNINIVRLDTRVALPYQMQSQHEYTKTFFDEFFGKEDIEGIPVASGGFIGVEGTVIVDKIKNPKQVIGIADGSGGVKASEQFNESDRNSLRKIQKAISVGYQTLI